MYTHTLMSNLIKAKRYSKEQALNMLDVFLGFGRLTVDQYAELTLLCDEVYEINHNDEFTNIEEVEENQQATLEEPTI